MGLRETFWIYLLVCTAFSYKPPLRGKSPFNIVVAQDGTGDYTTIQAAIDACKSFPEQRIHIFIKRGVYHEKVLIPSWNTRITLTGAGPDSTVISYDDYFARIGRGPNSTFFTATLLVEGNDFHADSLTIENRAGPVGQAIAVAVEADRCIFRDCRLVGNQDTLYLSGEGFRQYFEGCAIEGTTDFIFGEATALFEKCIITCKSDSYITAASTPENSACGFVFRDCILRAPPGIRQVYLGRPWRRYARVVFMQCTLGAFIDKAGWSNWKGTDYYRTAYFAEYRDNGPGAASGDRVGWSHQLTDGQAGRYTTANIFSGTWLPLQSNF